MCPSVGPQLPRLCAIVDQDTCARTGLSPVQLADAYLSAGARWVQLRAKHADGATMLRWAEAIAALVARAGAQLVVNDRADIARLCGAGVHVGQEDLPASAARRVVGESALVGLSTHTATQATRALEAPIGYLAVGPIFGTDTKQTGYEPVGLALVRQVAAIAAGRVPVVAIGGITLDRAADVLNAGAAAVAVIGDLMTGDPRKRCERWCRQVASVG